MATDLISICLRIYFFILYYHKNDPPNKRTLFAGKPIDRKVIETCWNDSKFWWVDIFHQTILTNELRIEIIG